MTETKQKTNDVYIAWHPVEGALASTVSRSRGCCEERLLKTVFNFDPDNSHARTEDYYAARDVELIRASNDGWRIKKAKIVMDDEVEND